MIDLGDNGVKEQPWVFCCQVRGSLALNKCVEPSLVEDVVILSGVLVKRRVLRQTVSISSHCCT